MTLIARVRTVLAGFTGGPGIATHYWGTSLGSTFEGELAGILLAEHDAWEEMVTMMPSSMGATNATDVDIFDDQTGELDRTISGTSAEVIGTADDAYGPLATGLCVTWRTGGIVGGKHLRGRTFLVPVGANAIQYDGSPTEAALVAAHAYADHLVAARGTGHELLVWSRPKWNDDHTTVTRVGSSYPVTSESITDKFAVLRSRRD